MNVLGIETATTVCAAAVVRDGRILAEASLDKKHVHAEKLMVQIDAVLRQSGFLLEHLDGIAISIGPGSFTGLRIGLSVAKGLAFASGKPLVAVPTLQALAQRVVDEKIASEDEHILAVLDARRDEMYCQWFTSEQGSAHPLGVEQDMSVERVVDESPMGRVFITGDGRAKLLQVIGSGHPETRWHSVSEAIAQCGAGTVGRIGELLIARGETADATTLEPKYIKEFFFRQQL